MNLTVDIQSASVEPVPEEDDIHSWIAAALEHRCPRQRCEVSVRLVDRDEMTTLNTTYRGKSGPTNVLSFPAEIPAGVNDSEEAEGLLGDIVICAPVVREEAASQGKTEQAHWAHMAVHGALHLLGYDHIDDNEADTMEALETTILASLNYPCPYSDNVSHNSAIEREHTTP